MPNLPDLWPDALSIGRALRSDSQALRDSEEWVRRNIDQLDREQARWLYDQYKIAYQRMTHILESVYDQQGKAHPELRAKLLDQIERELWTLYGIVSDHLDPIFEEAARRGYYGRAWALDMATNPDIVPSFNQLLPREAIRSMLLTDYLGKPWHDDLGYNFQQYVGKIKSSLTQSLISGESMATAQKRLAENLGVKTGKKGKFKANFARTLMITRTEIMRASNLGALAIYEQNQDILSGWEWVATLDERTCKICGRLDGKRFKFGDPMMAPPSGSHIGCRCTPVPVLIDSALMDAVAGVRQTYGEWAAQHGIAFDGKLADQKIGSLTSVGSAQTLSVIGKTAKEAEQWARANGFTVNYGGNLGAGNFINESLNELNQKGVRIPRNVEFLVSPEEFTSDDQRALVYEHTRGREIQRILINPYRNWDEYAQIAQDQYDDHWWASPKKYGVVIHEVGHSIDASANEDRYFNDLKGMQLSLDQKIIMARVSNYGARSRNEFIAETFHGLMAGMKYDDDVMNLYQTWNGPGIE
jgi:SPP1 gp7 family putative phage head morphogenesis protein